MSNIWSIIRGYPLNEDTNQSSFMTAESVATLGSKEGAYVTCSEDMCRRRFTERPLDRVASFEDGAERVKTGKSLFLLVPAAYPKIRSFFMDSELIARESFLATIPELGIVKADKNSQVIDKLYYHPATTSLLPKLSEKVGQAIQSSSNAEAYNSMMEGGPQDACMTNALVASHYGKTLHQVLREPKPMGWFVFERASNNFNQQQ